jgi:ABC-2 type transport system ATP-binding protein
MNAEKEKDKIKVKIGVQLQSSAYYAFLTLKEILQLFGQFYPTHQDPMQLLESVNLKEKANSYIGKLSGGQRQRFSIVASLINDPDIVFLDEPTTGLDPRARRKLWDLITEIKKQGKTIVLTTHYLEEAEMLCDHIAIMENGSIIAKDKTHKLIEMAKTPFKLNFFAPKITGAEVAELGKIAPVHELVGKSHYYEMGIQTQKDLDTAITLLQAGSPESFTVGRASLEDVFIELTGKKLQEDEGKDD